MADEPNTATAEQTPAVDTAAEDAQATDPALEATGEATGGQPIFAGKLKGVVALEKATREITQALGLTPLPEGSLIGKGTPFADALALEKDYLAKQALQGKLGNAKKDEPKAPALKPGELPKIDETPKTAATPAATDDIDGMDYEKIVDKAGLKLSELEAKWRTKGTLDEADYAKFKAIGRGRAEVDRTFRTEAIAREAVVGKVMGEINTLAGGEDQRAVVLGWAAGHYKGDEQADMNRRLQDAKTCVAAFKEIMFDYSRNSGSAGSRPIVDGSRQTASTGPITDAAEWRTIDARIKNNTASEGEKIRYLSTSKVPT